MKKRSNSTRQNASSKPKKLTKSPCKNLNSWTKTFRQIKINKSGTKFNKTVKNIFIQKEYLNFRYFVKFEE